MKKLSLEMDDLRVESFSTVEAPGADRGTVQGHEITGSKCSVVYCPVTAYVTCPATPRAGDAVERVTDLCC